MPTSITVRVQVKGGKFLADDIGGAEVTIRDSSSSSSNESERTSPAPQALY